VRSGARIANGSWLVSVVRSAEADSVVAAWCRRAAARVPVLRRDVQRGTPFDDRRVLAELERSRIFRTLVAVLDRADRARSGSRVAHAMSAARERFLSFDLAQRIRLTAIVVVVASLVHLLLSLASASVLLPAALVFWGVVLALSSGTMAAADGVAAAWIDRSSAHVARNESDRA
jgi:hypothetical protein